MKSVIRKTRFLSRALALSIASYLQAVSLTGLSRYKNLRYARRVVGQRPHFLVIQLGGVGDFVLTTPLLEALRGAYGASVRISVMTGTVNLGLATVMGLQDVIAYDSPRYARRVTGPGYERAEACLARDGYTHILWVRGDLRVLSSVVASAALFRAPALEYNPLRWAWLPLLRERAAKARHFVETLDGLVPDVAVKPSAFAPRLPEPPAPREAAPRGGIALHLGAGNRLRTMPAEFFSALIAMILSGIPGCPILLLGEGSESQKAEQLIASIPAGRAQERVSNHCRQDGLPEFIARLRSVGLYVGVDSGPLHIAAAIGLPVVALYGPQAPELFGPRGTGPKRIIRHGFACSPCWQFACVHSESGCGACLSAIQPAEVFAEVKSLWDSTKTRSIRA